MASTGIACFSVLLIVVAVSTNGVLSATGGLNPEADEICQGSKFTSCSRMTKHMANCTKGTNATDDEKDTWSPVKCADDALNEMQLRRLCIDNQRKAGQRFLELYQKLDEIICQIEEEGDWKKMNATEQQQCWEAFRTYGLFNLFGFGTVLDCIISPWNHQWSMDKIAAGCKNSKAFEKYYLELMKTGNCVIGGSACLSRNPLLLAMTSLFSILCVYVRA